MKKFSSRLAIIFLIIWTLAVPANAATTLIPGGQLLGLELRDNTVTVADFHETLGNAAKSAGLAKGDRILRIDNVEIHSAADVQQALQSTDDTVKLTVLRGSKTKTMTLRPPLTDDGPRLGIYLKQGVTGIGTVTYYDPHTGDYAALGHGVNLQTGALLELVIGNAYPARVISVKKGKIGTPGQLLGTLSDAQPVGSIISNTPQGIFGSSAVGFKGDALPVGTPKDVKAGPATIRSTVSEDGIREYSVEILKIYPNAPDRCRNMLLKITDPQLLQATGGIVQGMSGSPIIQDGKLVGAVTHVLVNDPTMGYGIFIENMLDAAA